MAQPANTENVNKSRQPPDARYAVQMIRGDIKKKKDRISGINGEIGDTWAKIEGRGINKTGAKIFALLDKLEADERVDAMRTLDLMCDVAEWPEQAEDLVDAAEGKVVPLRTSKKEPAADETDVDADLEEIEADIDNDDDDVILVNDDGPKDFVPHEPDFED